MSSRKQEALNLAFPDFAEQLFAAGIIPAAREFSNGWSKLPDLSNQYQHKK
jgi:hypothetical protein